VKNNIPIIEKPKVLFYTKKEFANYIIFVALSEPVAIKIIGLLK
jgi:hypothetical protein